MYNNVLFYEKGKSTITLEINKSIGICLFLCDVLKILLKNYKSGDRSVQSWKKVCIRGKIVNSTTAERKFSSFWCFF